MEFLSEKEKLKGSKKLKVIFPGGEEESLMLGLRLCFNSAVCYATLLNELKLSDTSPPQLRIPSGQGLSQAWGARYQSGIQNATTAAAALRHPLPRTFLKVSK